MPQPNDDQPREPVSPKAAANPPAADESIPPFPWTPERTREYVQKYTRHIEVRGHYALRFGIALALGLLRSLSWKSAWRLGDWVGRAMHLLRIRREVAMINLDIVYGDRKTAAEKEEIYRQSLINVARQAINYTRAPLMDRKFWNENYRLLNEDFIREVYNRRKGAIMLSCHHGSWELAGGKMGMSGYPIAIVAKILPNPVMDKLIVEARASMNLSHIAHKASMQRIMEGLRRGEGLILIIDQNMKRDQGMFVNWMGHTASTMRSTAWIARETGAPVVAGRSRQVDADHFELWFTEEVPWQAVPGDPEKELLVNAQNQADAVGRIILGEPELWLWLHRRWKIQPEGAPNPYDKKK